MISSRQRQTEVYAVLGEEFDQILDQLDIGSAFEAGKYDCQNCHETINKENVLLIFPLVGQKVGFLCKDKKCVVEYAVAG